MAEVDEIILMREECSPYVMENTYAVFINPPVGDFTKRFSWDSDTASQHCPGNHYATWQEALTHARKYAQKLAAHFGCRWRRI